MTAVEKGPCLLAVRLRGTVGDNPEVRKTLENLRLVRVYNARLLQSTPSNNGMLRAAKNLVAWGEVDPATLELLLAKRAEGENKTMILDEDFLKRRFGKDGFAQLASSLVSGEIEIGELWRAGLKPRFRLHPP